MKRAFLTGLALLAMPLALTGCDTQEEVAAETDGIPGIEIANARMVLNAVEGNPAAVYFDIAYEGDRNLTIRAADVEGAESAALHSYGEWEGQVQMMDALPVPLKTGETVSFKPGDLHVMAMNPSSALQPGRTAEVTLTVAGGDKISFPATIQAAGDADVE